MNRLLKIARSASPGTGIQLRGEAYGNQGVRRFLRDVLAMANAAVDGPRYIITGVEMNESGHKRVCGVDVADFSGKPSYQSLVADFIEPPIRLKYQPVTIDGKQVGVYEIADCQDKPYMMRVDQSENLRRGDAYARVKTSSVKLGRRQLQQMFETKFRDSVSADNIEIGFPGEIIHKQCQIVTTDLSAMPSALAGAKLRKMIGVQQQSQNTGSTTVMARLMHARLFGSDEPYENRSPDTLIQEMAQVKRRHQYDDEYFLFEQNTQKIQLVVFNQGDDAIEDASLSLALPNHSALYVASRLPKTPHKGSYIDRGPAELADYPAVSLKDDVIYVSSTLGQVSTNEKLTVFETPLRLCVGNELKGRKIGIRYSLFGRNLRTPVQGKLRLTF